MTTPNEELQALLTELRDSRLMRLHGDAYMPRIEAALARQEEGREAVAWQIRYAFNGQLEESWRGITRAEYERAISSEYKDERGKGFEVRALYSGIAPHISAEVFRSLYADMQEAAKDSNDDPFVMIDQIRLTGWVLALGKLAGEVAHPTPPIAALAPHSGGEVLLERPARVAGRDFMPGQPVQQLVGRAEAHYNVHYSGATDPRLATPAPQSGEAAPRMVCGSPDDGRTCYPDCDCETERDCTYGTVSSRAWTDDDARAYIRDWCPDHVKDYIERLSAPASPQGVSEVWHAARNAWMAASRHGTQEAADNAAIEVLARGLRTDGLFALHLMGPDSIYAAPSYEAALRVANAVNVEFADRPVKPYAVVVPWNGDAESHAAGLTDWEGAWN